MAASAESRCVTTPLGLADQTDPALLFSASQRKESSTLPARTSLADVPHAVVTGLPVAPLERSRRLIAQNW